MTTQAPWAQAPAAWLPVPGQTIARAKAHALAALADTGPDPVGARLAAVYDTDGDHAGATFTTLPPNDPGDVTGADVAAVHLLGCSIGPRAVRRLMSGAHRSWVLTALRNLPGEELLTAAPATLEAMEDLYLAVRSALSAAAAAADPWVSVSALCARKRPGLFPVLDGDVCRHLGIDGPGDFRAGWQVLRALIQDDEIRRAVDALPAAVRAAAGDRQVVLDDADLRLLCSALSTWGTST